MKSKLLLVKLGNSSTETEACVGNIMMERKGRLVGDSTAT